MVRRVEWLEGWLVKCSDALERSYSIYKLMKQDPNVNLGKRKEYGRYWYSQEFKFNRMIEEKSILQALIKRMHGAELEEKRMMVRFCVVLLCLLNLIAVICVEGVQHFAK